MKIRVNFGLLILFGIFVISSIMLNPVLAQIPTMTGVGVKINTPSDSVSVPVGDLTINGASSDNNTTNCQVYADWNDLKPMQIVTANGPKGDADYSKWSYTYNGDYHGIVEGSNELTSKITCYDQVQKATSSKSYSINVTGTKAGSEIVNNTGNPSTVSEDTKILPVQSSSSNDESSNDTVEKSNESTDTDSDSEDTNVIPVKNILPLYSESNEESIKSASTEDADETEVASTDTVELQDEPNSNETEVASTDTVELQDEPTSKEIIDSDSETYATVSSKQQGETGESNTIDMSESEATEASDEGLTSHSESNTFFTFEPDLVADEFSNNDENTVGTSSNTDSSVSNHDSDDNSIFGLKFNGLEDATKNKIEKKIEKLEDRIADRVQLFDLIG
ncbi:MAG: hypothetical protein QOK85_07535 [Nitrososphaeraceae archaeon]|nr:hypothetical protein [Nitrososphaeraceae archaeon]